MQHSADASIPPPVVHAVQQRLPAASAGIVWKKRSSVRPPSEWRLRNQNPALIFVLTARSEELGQRGCLATVAVGLSSMDLSSSVECVGVARGVQGKSGKQASNKLYAHTYVHEARVGYRNLCRVQAVVLRLDS